jgi:hypothetical protein
MPKTSINYDNSIIYTISKRDLVYVGSTTDFIRRQYEHKYGTNNNIYVNYIIMDINRENFILDRSCLKIYNECSNKEILNKYNRYFVKIKDEFDLKYKNKGIYVFKRKDKF